MATVLVIFKEREMVNVATVLVIFKEREMVRFVTTLITASQHDWLPLREDGAWRLATPQTKHSRESCVCAVSCRHYRSGTKDNEINTVYQPVRQFCSC